MGRETTLIISDKMKENIHLNWFHSNPIHEVKLQTFAGISLLSVHAYVQLKKL